MAVNKILMAHNYYQIHGGEEESFRAENTMLLHKGHKVITYTRSNDEIQVGGVKNQALLFLNTIWSKDSYHTMIQLIRETKPDIAHFQNIFPLISPSAYYACKDEGVPVVQSLRNYRLICSNGFFFRNGKICEDCLGKSLPWPGVIHACYRRSRTQSIAVASMLTYHRVIHTWDSQVDLYIALTEFSRNKFIQAGLPPEKVVVKPNYISDPGKGNYPGKYVVYVGRLSEEKGIDLLLEAWLDLPDVPLKIVGEGPLATSVQKFIQTNKVNVELLGRLENVKAMDVIKKSAFLVFTSLWYETFGRTLVEAFACGKPVIAPYHGTSAELVDDGKTGLFFIPGSSVDLTEKVTKLWRSAELRLEMGRNARSIYEEKYTIDRNYVKLIDIYNYAIKGSKTT